MKPRNSRYDAPLEIATTGCSKRPFAFEVATTVIDPDGFERLISKDSCDGCRHLHFVTANPCGSSHNGWGCLMSGGHAVKRCELFEEAP
jgi:hypothetical protein